MPVVLLPDLVLVVGFVVALGLLYVYDNTLHYAFLALAAALTFTILGRHIGFGDKIINIDNTIRNALSDWAHGIEKAMGQAFHDTAEAARWWSREIGQLSQDTLSMGHWFVHTFVPAYVHGVTDLIHSTSTTITRVQHVTETKVIRITKVIEARTAAVPTHIAQTVRAAIAAELPTVETIPRIAWRDILHWKDDANIRLRRLESLFGATAAAALIANVLGIPSWRCLTKGPIGRVSRALCGLSAAGLEDLLGLLVDLFVLADICDVISLLEQGLSLVSGPLTDWIGGADKMFVHCGYDLPGKLPETPGLSLPPVTGVTLSLV